MAPVRLRLHRGPGVVYAALAAVLLVLLLLGVRSSLLHGHVAAAIVATLVGLAVVGYLGLLSAAIVGPDLSVSTTGVVGRVGPRTAVDLEWDAVTVDVDGDARGRFRLSLGAESLVVERRWLGFTDFVLLLASTPAAVDALTPAARVEVVRLLGIGRPG